MVRTSVAFLVLVPYLILLLPVFAFAILALSFTSAVRALGRFTEPSCVPSSSLVTFDSRLGWRYQPNLDAYYLAARDDVFHIVTDSEGWPGRRSLDDSPVVVIGDSFAVGYGVDTRKSCTEISSRLPMKAVGAQGYSMVHEVLLLEQLDRRVAGKLVVWFAYPENDLQDNLAPATRWYRAPFVRMNPQGKWEISTEHITPTRWACSNSHARRFFPRICVPGPFSDRLYSAAEYLIGRAHAACERAGARLVMVTIPHPMQLTPGGLEYMRDRCGDPELCDQDLADRRIAESCRRIGVPMLAAKAHLSPADYKRREGVHWNEKGHRKMARIVESLYDAFKTGTLGQFAPGDAIGSDDGKYRVARETRPPARERLI
jgi:hypothetical protein